VFSACLPEGGRGLTLPAVKNSFLPIILGFILYFEDSMFMFYKLFHPFLGDSSGTKEQLISDDLLLHIKKIILY